MSEHEPSLVGTMLGSYRITGELSKGGMGAVYRAEHAVLERKVAVKLLRPELTANRELVMRFINEAKAASAIQHPGIIEVLDFGHASDGRAYFVMEMLEGESLAHRIEVRGKLPELEAAKLAKSIASALAAAHGKGIIHRDLKPDNVFVVADPDVGERAKVLDFGIAKLGDRPSDATKYTQTGALMGTPLYMAPEQARAAGQIDARADLYSLGCILYEMLVGQPPFMAVGAGEIIALQLFGTAELPSKRVPGISPAIEAIVMRLLEKEPADRYASALAVANALAPLVGEPVVPLPSVVPASEPRRGTAAPTERVTAPPAMTGMTAAVERSRSPAWIAALAVFALVVIAVVTFIVLRHEPQPQQQPQPQPQPQPPQQPQAQPQQQQQAQPQQQQQPQPQQQPQSQQQSQPQPQQVVTDVQAPGSDAKQPAKREKPRQRDQKGSAADPRHTKDGSPIEIDIN